MPVNASHERYLDILIGRTRAVRYPSHQLLARIEGAIADRQDAERYVDVILDAAEGQRYPSLRMLDRAARVVRAMVVADLLERREQEAQGDGEG